MKEKRVESDVKVYLNRMAAVPLEVHRGGLLTAAFAPAPSGAYLAKEFLDDLTTDKNWRAYVARIYRTIQHLCEEHRLPDTMFHKQAGTAGIWVLKAFQIRVTAFIHEGTVFLLHGFIKKDQRTERNELIRAERLKAEFLGRVSAAKRGMS